MSYWAVTAGLAPVLSGAPDLSGTMKGITLFIFGGIAEMDDEPPNAHSEFMMAIAGPLASVVIGFVFYVLERAGRASAPIQRTGLWAYLATPLQHSPIW